MISAQNLTVRFGARVLFSGANLLVNKNDKVGLVGRNGAGKTTLTKVFSGEHKPDEGTVRTTGTIGFLPQDPKVANLKQTAMQRILSGRGLDAISKQMSRLQEQMLEKESVAIIEKFAKLQDRYLTLGGYAGESEAFRIADNLGLSQSQLSQPLEQLSGGQRRRIELARILFSDADTLILDEPTNHLDADSIVWLRDFLKSFGGGVVLISHDVDLIDHIVNKVWFLDPMRSVIDIYNMNYQTYLKQRSQDEKRRKVERETAMKKAEALMFQANKMRAKATKAVAAQNMIRRAEKMLEELPKQEVRQKVASISFVEPQACGKVPLEASGLAKNYGSQEVFSHVSFALDKGSRVIILGLNGAGKTTLLKILAGVETADQGQVIPGHGLKIAYFAQEHDTLRSEDTIFENMRRICTGLSDGQIRDTLGAFLFSGDDIYKPVSVLSGGEKTRVALAATVVQQANVLLLDEPTNNLDPVSREQVLHALEQYPGAIVLVSHDPGAVEALAPDRVILMPDGDEDLWSDGYADLISLV